MASMGDNVYCMVLAGGMGERLKPLTEARSKPAVFYGGKYRLIDITLSNTWHSKIRKVGVLTMVDPRSLENHIAKVWTPFYARGEEYINWLSPPHRVSDKYVGSADAVFQNLREIKKDKKIEQVLILGGDHVYKMDYREYHDLHKDSCADLTVSGIPVSFEDEANYDVKPDGSKRFKFGTFMVNEQGKVIQFVEKPLMGDEVFKKLELKDNPGKVLASMGIYFFTKESLIRVLQLDAEETGSKRDFGGNIVPRMVNEGYRVFAYDYSKNSQAKANKNYWRDVGDIYQYWRSNMDLIEVVPDFDIHTLDWRIFGREGELPPTKFVFSNGRKGHALDSIVCEGCIISGAEVLRSVIGPNVRIEDYSFLDNSIVFFGARIGNHVKLHNTIVEKKVEIPDGVEIGFDKERDKAKGLTVRGDITVIPNINLPAYEKIDWKA